MPSFGFGHSPRSLFRTATQKSDDRTPNRLLVIAVVLDLEACLCSAISKTHRLCKEFALERGKSLGRRKQRAIESGSRTLATDKMKAVSKLRPWKTSSKSSTSSDAGSGPTTEQSSSNSNSTSYTGSTSSPPSSAPVSDIDLAEQAIAESDWVGDIDPDNLDDVMIASTTITTDHRQTTVHGIVEVIWWLVVVVGWWLVVVGGW